MPADSDLIQPVVLTAPIRDAPHLPALVQAFTDAGGFAPPIVHVDTDLAGAAEATRRALLAARGMGRHVLFLEDDIAVDRTAPATISRLEFPDGVAAISLCDMREVPEFSPPGLYERSPMGSDGRGWWGNQALLLHRDTVDMCCSADWFAPEIESARGVRAHATSYDDDGRNCSDIRLALLVDRYGGARRRYAVHVPSLFRHMGEQSACFPGRGLGERETRNWIGDRRRFGLDTLIEPGPPRSDPDGSRG